MAVRIDESLSVILFEELCQGLETNNLPMDIRRFQAGRVHLRQRVIFHVEPSLRTSEGPVQPLARSRRALGGEKSI